MSGQRLYTMIVKTRDGKELNVNFWSRSKKGSIENFCDGLSAIKIAHNIEGKEIDSWEISFAQTSLSRR